MKRILKIAGLIISFLGTIFLLVAANKKIGEQLMAKPRINLTVRDGISLISEQELLNELYLEQLFRDNIQKSSLNINEIEEYINALHLVQHAEVYTELDNSWYVDITTRRPIARVVLENRNDFYIDDNYELMRLSPYAKPKIIAFTGIEQLIQGDFDFTKLINNDSLKTQLKLNQIYHISNYVCNDAFFASQVVQVHYDEKDGFLLVPRVGGNIVVFGSAESEGVVKEKFSKLITFYKEVIPYEGWSKYESINLKFRNQIVAKKKE